PPVFALNGTYDSNETFLVGIFDLGNASSDSAPPTVHFLGGNFTANSSGDALSMLTNSTPALLDYTPPGAPSGTDADRFVYLVFNQTENADFSSVSTSQTQNFSISDFINQTGLNAPIGGTMVWLKPADDDVNSNASSVPSS
ncbi:hypothetical protein DFH11DRAFT_1495684, partial [Phellopilus nigrolimitatus]